MTARRLFAGAEFRGADARLVDRVDLPDEDAVPHADPALASAIASWSWQVRAAYDLVADHINAQELRAFVGLISPSCRSSANLEEWFRFWITSPRAEPRRRVGIAHDV